ncbi:hypothetical protein [Roseiconus lacunae]|uniref:hypothetical protein n=1 Tax=Roseiconus lacunae TaxID=2605694 RepID=UPI0028F45FDE|nr:hypothetical protein [Roseiconus lacunae]WRQ53904.1 hypothetical protein U8335_00995 [Stieleria sp. HD01]
MAETLGVRISGRGRSFSETLERDFDRDRFVVAAAVRELPAREGFDFAELELDRGAAADLEVDD